MSERWVLVVEDDAELGRAFTEILEISGLRTQRAANGREALDVLANAEPDLVILDLHLPEVSGPQVLAYIRSEPRLENTRVVITSADVALAEHLKEQADLVLVKPVSFADMLGLAERFFGS